MVFLKVTDFGSNYMKDKKDKHKNFHLGFLQTLTESCLFLPFVSFFFFKY